MNAFQKYDIENIPNEHENTSWKRLSDLANTTAKEREWTVKGWVPRGQVTLLYADGGVGKSQIILQLLTSVAKGESWFGLETSKGTVMYLGAEDDEDELHRRFEQILFSQFARYEDYINVIYRSLAGQDALLAAIDPMTKQMTPTSLMNEIEVTMSEYRPVLFVIDTLADVFPADENNRALARQFISMLRKPAIENNCAVVVLAHPSLTGMASGRGTSGSTGWSNSVRSRINLKRDEYDPNLRVLSLMKSNYGRIGSEINLRWENGVFVHDPHSSALDAQAANSKARRVFLSLLDTHVANGNDVNANGGSTYAPKVFSEHPDAEGVSKNAFKTAMKSLLAEKQIVKEKTARSTRLVRSND